MTLRNLIIFLLIITSCNNKNSATENSKGKATKHAQKVEPVNIEKKEEESGIEPSEQEQNEIYSKESLNKADSATLDSLRTSLPLSWERFGIENKDTVSYDFCGASNPQFSLNNDLTAITISIGNELHEKFQIEEIFYNDSIYLFSFKEKKMGLEKCILLIKDKSRQIGKLLIYDANPEDSYSYLPKTILSEKRRIVYDCDSVEE
ncbi:hypothetical protein QYS49_35300 [Marivirga salinae]|uniref:Lipoprotein n=1 Tax=Marivirga salinarum TaxID=3059078 RepID=A0AA51NCZ7_9BACT|nr:hypothetical protein [Marivirga sp. BDSF4-3]WMN13009.1 hypothetical protein QYS49_35300 [Marivirga sp. BDSF4-3]